MTHLLAATDSALKHSYSAFVYDCNSKNVRGEAYLLSAALKHKYFASSDRALMHCYSAIFYHCDSVKVPFKAYLLSLVQNLMYLAA